MYLMVGIGGIFGAMLRFIVSGWFTDIGNIPLTGTLCVNLTGCFILGLLQGLARIYQLPDWLIMGMGTGFIGAFTTFSTFSVEVITYIDQGFLLLPIIYLLLSSVGGYFSASFGFTLVNRRGV